MESLLKIVVTFVFVFIGFLVGDLIAEVLKINSEFFHMIILVISVVIMNTLGDIIKSKIRK